MNENEKRIETEVRIIRKLIRMMKESGWHAVVVDDGEDLQKVQGELQAIRVAFSVGEAAIGFKRKEIPARCWVRVVLGNNADVISDYSERPGFSEVMEAHMDWVEKTFADA
jgi:hypothetical protein